MEQETPKLNIQSRERQNSPFSQPWLGEEREGV